MEESQDNIVYEIQPYMFEPNPGDNVESGDSESDSTSTDDSLDEEFEAINSWRLTTLEWCKFGQCQLMSETIESFCCHEKAVEYDEYDGKLTSAQVKDYPVYCYCLPSFKTCYRKMC